MRKFIEAMKARKENGEAGFSLVELIVVVVILGILAAVAIPIFNNIQNQARDNAVKAAAASAVSQVAAALAEKPNDATAEMKPVDNDEFTFTWVGGEPDKGAVGDICITATSAASTADKVIASTQGTRAGCAADTDTP